MTMGQCERNPIAGLGLILVAGLLLGGGGGGSIALIGHAPIRDGGAEITSYEHKKTAGTWQTLDSTYEAPDNNRPYRCRRASSLRGLDEGTSPTNVTTRGNTHG